MCFSHQLRFVLVIFSNGEHELLMSILLLQGHHLLLLGL